LRRANEQYARKRNDWRGNSELRTRCRRLTFIVFLTTERGLPISRVSIPASNVFGSPKTQNGKEILSVFLAVLAR